jgi:hypothetical protein
MAPPVTKEGGLQRNAVNESKSKIYILLDTQCSVNHSATEDNWLDEDISGFPLTAGGLVGPSPEGSSPPDSVSDLVQLYPTSRQTSLFIYLSSSSIDWMKKNLRS